MISSPPRSTETASLISLRHVSKSFGPARNRNLVLDNVSLDIADHEFVSLVGPSGCGKSTLLNIIAGLTPPDSGQVLANGQIVSGGSRDRMMMFQEHALFPWLDVTANVVFPLLLDPALTPRDRKEIAMHHLKLVKLEKQARSRVHELSGGMKQRVALARALAPNPRVLLMDEPFSALDALTREQLYGDLQEIHSATRKTIVLVTHNIREAASLGDKVVLLAPNPGRITDSWAVSLPRPRDINDPDISAIAREISSRLKSIPVPVSQ